MSSKTSSRSPVEAVQLTGARPRTAGELLGSATHIEIRAAPNAFTVMAPAFRPKPKTVRACVWSHGAPSKYRRQAD